MDRIAVISDIHGNLPALNSVLEDIRGRNIDRIICLGDLAGKGPSSAEGVDLIRQHCETVVKGNWDFYITMREDDMTRWHREALGEERLEYLRQLPFYMEFYMSGKLVRLCHASPNDVFHRVYFKSPLEEILKLFEGTPTNEEQSQVVGYGDIHSAYTINFDHKTLFNVGSVGNPLDIPQASYGILEGIMDSKEPAPFSISLVRVPYDVEAAIRDAEVSDVPEKEEYIKELRTAVYRNRK